MADTSPPTSRMPATPLIPPTSNSRDDSPFDYVIVGSGAGGAPLAARLAEFGDRVLVPGGGAGSQHRHAVARFSGLLAGPGNHGGSGLHALYRASVPLSWSFFVDHYTKPPGVDPKWTNGKVFYPRATGIGGCTVHNAMITMAGPAADWDELAWFLDDDSWSSEVMRGYFQRLERCEYIPRPQRPQTHLQRIVETLLWLFGKDEDPTGGRHGFGGWLHTSVVDFRIGLADKQLVKMLYGAAITSAKAGMEGRSRVLSGRRWSAMWTRCWTPTTNAGSANGPRAWWPFPRRSRDLLLIGPAIDRAPRNGCGQWRRTFLIGWSSQPNCLLHTHPHGNRGPRTSRDRRGVPARPQAALQGQYAIPATTEGRSIQDSCSARR